MLESYQDKVDTRSTPMHDSPVVSPSPAQRGAPTSNDKTSLLESAQGQEYWSTMGQPGACYCVCVYTIGCNGCSV